jgi:hypothetical protein
VNIAARKLPPLLLPGVALAAAVVCAVLLVGRGERMVRDAQGRLDAQSRVLADAKQRFANAGAEKDIINRYLGSYRKLQDLGFVGGERRIAWVDALTAANKQAGLFGVEYQVSQQSDFPRGADLGAGGLPLKQSVMKLKMQLLHEGDLMTFFRALAAQRAGVFLMNGCQLRRAVIGPAQAALQPNLNAECEIAWLSVSETEAEAGAR